MKYPYSSSGVVADMNGLSKELSNPFELAFSVLIVKGFGKEIDPLFLLEVLEIDLDLFKLKSSISIPLAWWFWIIWTFDPIIVLAELEEVGGVLDCEDTDPLFELGGVW